ncbi:hypothetical protein F4776DRAFT_560319 [Hypoxylon sp. NC0597]|nr:hypothetical protein F4776DRAFT_560319 [Hypoxylon sp. NC0597]
MPQKHQQLQKHHAERQNTAEPNHEQHHPQRHRQDLSRQALLLERRGIGIVCVCVCVCGAAGIGFVRGRLRFDVYVLGADEGRALAGRGRGGALVVVRRQGGFWVWGGGRGGGGGVLGFELEGRHGWGVAIEIGLLLWCFGIDGFDLFLWQRAALRCFASCLDGGWMDLGVSGLREYRCEISGMYITIRSVTVDLLKRRL